MVHATVWSFIGMHFIWWVFWIVLIMTAFATVTPVPKSQMKYGERALECLVSAPELSFRTMNSYLLVLFFVGRR